MSIKLPEPIGPVPFRGPHRRRYTPEQLAENYNVSTSLIIRWIQGGYFGDVKQTGTLEQTGRYTILERQRQYFEHINGCPSNPKTRLPL